MNMKIKNKNGFTLLEAIIVAGLAVILVGLSIPSINSMQKKLTQKQLDASAEVLYHAASASLTNLYTTGQQDLYRKNYYTPADGLTPLPDNYYPSNASSETDYAQGYTCYLAVDSNRELANKLFPRDVSDKGLWDNYWVVEFNWTSGAVYGVFYSEEPIDYEPNEFNQYRLKENRKNGNIGYYGCGTVFVDDYTPERVHGTHTEIIIEQEEENNFHTGFVYYEIYKSDDDMSTNDYGYWYADGTISDEPLQDRLVIGDGYGVAISSDERDITINVVSGSNSLEFGYSGLVNTPRILAKNGVIIGFPASWMKADWLSQADITKSTPTNKSQYNTPFFTDIAIDYSTGGYESYVYSPFYAECAYSSSPNGENLPNYVVIRSPRHLYSLSWLYSSYFNKKWAWNWTETRVASTTFFQELDIDYNSYDWNTYIGQSFVGQMPIGTDWGRFISAYEGNGHTIYNVKLLRRGTTGREYTYAGLFGFVSGTISNTNIVNNSGGIISIDNAEYCGVLAAYVQNSTIKSCSVSNYEINYSNTNTSTSYTSPNEFAYIRIGSFIGYLKAPGNNEQGSSDISSCYTNNCAINIANLTSGNYYRSYNIGGFIGSIADREQSDKYSQLVTVKDCSTECTITTKSYGLGTNWCYIGGFAGACGKTYVDNCYCITNGITKNQNAFCYGASDQGKNITNCYCFNSGNHSSYLKGVTQSIPQT